MEILQVDLLVRDMQVVAHRQVASVAEVEVEAGLLCRCLGGGAGRRGLHLWFGGLRLLHRLSRLQARISLYRGWLLNGCWCRYGRGLGLGRLWMRDWCSLLLLDLVAFIN